MGARAHPVLLIAGPTASGKSALALRLAERIGGEVVNADSMQVYRDIPILSAAPSAAERARVPHHLFGHVDAAERYSVGRWLEEALAAIESIEARGSVPILVGGAGLYFRALTHGLADIPDPGPQARARARGLLAEPDALVREAARLDPEAAARVAPGDRQRLLRIVSVAYETGRPLSALRAGTAPPLAPDRWRGAALTLDVAALNARIAARLRLMAEAGAAAEAARLAARGLDPELPAMKALGVSAFAAMARGDLAPEAALEQAAAQTRRYAKRQRTWLRTQAPDWPRVAAGRPESDAELARRLGLSDAGNIG